MFPFYSNLLSNPNFHSELHAILKQGKLIMENNEQKKYGIEIIIEQYKLDQNKINIINCNDYNISNIKHKNTILIFCNRYTTLYKKTYDLFCCSIYEYYKYIRNEYNESSAMNHMQELLGCIELNVSKNNIEIEKQFEIALHLIDKTPNTLLIINTPQLRYYEVDMIKKNHKNIIVVNTRLLNNWLDPDYITITF
jgi:hypothetical protein